MSLLDAMRLRSAKLETNVAARPALWRRVVAGLIDRAAPLPLLALFFPAWTLVVLAYHLLCDATPQGRGLGKWVCRLRVVRNRAALPRSWWRAALRHVGAALAQAAWCRWQWLAVALVYELAALAWVLLDPLGRRPEDLLAGTRVVTEKAWRKR